MSRNVNTNNVLTLSLIIGQFTVILKQLDQKFHPNEYKFSTLYNCKAINV